MKPNCQNQPTKHRQQRITHCTTETLSSQGQAAAVIGKSGVLLKAWAQIFIPLHDGWKYSCASQAAVESICSAPRPRFAAKLRRLPAAAASGIARSHCGKTVQKVSAPSDCIHCLYRTFITGFTDPVQSSQPPFFRLSMQIYCINSCFTWPCIYIPD